MLTKFSVIFFLNACFWQIGFAAPSKTDELLSETQPQALSTPKAQNFWKELQNKGRNPDTDSSYTDVLKLVQDLLNPYRPAENRSEFFDCRQREGVHALYMAGTYLVEISLSNKPTESAKQVFRNNFITYEANCPEDVEKGKRFFDTLASTLESARDERNRDLERRKLSEIQAKEELARRKVREKQESLTRDTARAKESEQFRLERKAQLDSGKIKPDSMDDVKLLTEATNGVRVVHNPPFRPDMQMYWTWGQLVDWDGDRLLVKWGSKHYVVTTNKATNFIGDTQRSLGKNRPIQVVGLLTNIADTPTGKMPVFQASYISSP